MGKPSKIVKAVYHEHISHFGEPAQMIRYDDPPATDGALYPELVDVMVWPPEEDLDMTTYATIGMSEMEMNGPNTRAELHMALEGEVDKETSGKITMFLANLSLYPFINNTFFDWWHVIPETGPIPHFKGMHSVLLYPAFVENGWQTICIDGLHVKILNVVPITPAELSLYRNGGIDELLKYFDRSEINLFAPRSESYGVQ